MREPRPRRRHRARAEPPPCGPVWPRDHEHCRAELLAKVGDRPIRLGTPGHNPEMLPGEVAVIPRGRAADVGKALAPPRDASSFTAADLTIPLGLVHLREPFRDVVDVLEQEM